MKGFVWDLDPTIVVLGPFQIRYYGLLFASVVVIGYYLWQWQMRKAGYDESVIVIFPYYIGALGIVGARLGHCLFYDPAYYLSNPISILKIWEGGLSSHGAAAGIVASILVFSYIKKVPWHLVSDSNAFLYAFLAILVRIGNFMNSEIMGRITDLPWCVHFVRYQDGGQYCRHPSQLYEASFGLAILVGLILLDRKLGKKRPPALLTGVFMVCYFFCRFFVEFLKEHQILLPDSPLTMGQYLSIPFFLLGAYLLLYAWRYRHEGVPSPRIAPQRKKRQKGRKR